MKLLRETGGLRLLLKKSFRGNSQPYTSPDLPVVRVLGSSLADSGKAMVDLFATHAANGREWILLVGQTPCSYSFGRGGRA
jgi:hypothetical protein